MKTIVNVIATAFFICLLKGGIIAPLYLLVAPFVTAYKWGSMRHLRVAIPFEIKCVWHCLRNDWRDGCKAFVFDIEK